MNIRLSLHNVLLIVAIAVLGILALRVVAPAVRGVPIVRDIARVGASA